MRNNNIIDNVYNLITPRISPDIRQIMLTPPYPEETFLNMIFDLNTRKTDTKEGCRHDRTDKCCTVTAYNHNNRNVCCFDYEFSRDADQDRHLTEEECLKDNLADLIAILIDYCTV